MRVLELFSGTECISNEFRKRGCECFTIDWDEQFPSSMHCDIGYLKIDDLPEEFRHPDVVFIAPDCRTYSLAAISKHRRKNKETGNLDPISQDAIKSDEVNQHVLELLKELNPKVWWIENPRACLQNMVWMKPLDQYKHVVTYCQYMKDDPIEERRMKPTNLWTNIPNPGLLPPCKKGDPCHPYSPRGTTTAGTQRIKGGVLRSMYPRQLSEAIVQITLDYLERSEEYDIHGFCCDNSDQ